MFTERKAERKRRENFKGPVFQAKEHVRGSFLDIKFMKSFNIQWDLNIKLPLINTNYLNLYVNINFTFITYQNMVHR